MLNVECETNNLCDYVSHTYNSVLDSLKGTLDLCLVQATRILSVDKADTTVSFLFERFVILAVAAFVAANYYRIDRLQRRVSRDRTRGRDDEWRKFQQNLQAKFAEADDQFGAQLEQVKKFYESKEHQLKSK